MTLKTLIAIFLLPSFLFAQANFGSFEASDFNSDPLVSTDNLPLGFKNFVQDSASQILLIPSKGASFTKDFVFANYSPQRGTTNSPISKDYPSFSLSYLNGNENKKWLYRLDFEQTYSKSISENDVFDNGLFSNETELIDDIQENERNNLLARFKIDMINKTNSGGYSIGLSAKINHNSDNLFDKDDREEFYLNEFSTIKNTSKSFFDLQSDFENENFIYSLGVEYTKSTKKWNYSSELSFNQAIQKDDNIIFSKTTTYDSTFSKDALGNYILDYYSVNSYELNANENGKDSPFTIGLKNYFQNSLNAFDKDANYFVGFDLAYSFGSKIELEASRIDVDIFSLQGELVSNDTTRINDFNKDFTSEYRKAKLIFGYVVDKKFDDLQFITGVSSEFLYTQVKSAEYYQPSSFNYSFTETNDKNWSFVTKFPIYLNYTPVKWFSVFGILNNGFTFSGLESEDLRTELESESTKTITKGNSKNFGLNSELSLGMSLRHKSGLVSHVAFNGDFGNFGFWNVSLGYLF